MKQMRDGIIRHQDHSLGMVHWITINFSYPPLCLMFGVCFLSFYFLRAEDLSGSNQNLLFLASLIRFVDLAFFPTLPIHNIHHFHQTVCPNGLTAEVQARATVLIRLSLQNWHMVFADFCEGNVCCRPLTHMEIL